MHGPGPHTSASMSLEKGGRDPLNNQPWGVKRTPQILVVKSEIDKKASQNCHRHKAFYTRPVVFRLGGSAFCVMRTSLGNPRAGALLFYLPSLLWLPRGALSSPIHRSWLTNSTISMPCLVISPISVTRPT